MQSEEAKKLRDSWGNKPCNHPDFSKEYYLGMQTMDYICTTCGEAFTLEEKKKIEKERGQN